MRHHIETTSRTLQASAGAGGQVVLSAASARSNWALRIRSYTADSLPAPVSAAPAVEACARRLHASTTQLLLSMPFYRETDQAIEELRKCQTARGPHLRIHPD